MVPNKGENMRKRLILIFLISFGLLIPSAQAVPPPDEIREISIHRYLKTITEVIRDPFDLHCVNITSLKRLGESGHFYEVEVELTTFHGPHNPPYELVRISLRDDEFDPLNDGAEGIHITNVYREEISQEQFMKRCN